MFVAIIVDGVIHWSISLCFVQFLLSSIIVVCGCGVFSLKCPKSESKHASASSKIMDKYPVTLIRVKDLMVMVNDEYSMVARQVES